MTSGTWNGWREDVIKFMATDDNSTKGIQLQYLQYYRKDGCDTFRPISKYVNSNV